MEGNMSYFPASPALWLLLPLDSIMREISNMLRLCVFKPIDKFDY